MAGMDKAEALAFVSRMFDAASAGAAIWGDPLLVKRFLSQCSRTGSEETIRGYRREIRDFMRWRDLHHPHLLLREMTAPFCQDFVDELRREVEAERLKPRTFNRRIAAVSSLFRWASEPSRSAVTGVPRNPIPSRSLLHAEKTTRGLSARWQASSLHLGIADEDEPFRCALTATSHACRLWCFEACSPKTAFWS